MDTPEVKRVKDRSPSFPFIPLKRALERAAEFYAEEKRGAAPYARAVMHWKYSEASSGGLQTASALKHYGLIEEAGGGGKERQLRLTDLALRILLDQRDDPSERQENIRRAAKMPSLAGEVYERWPELPSDGTLNHFLLIERKFNESTARATVNILKENQVFAGIQAWPSQSESSDKLSDSASESVHLNHVGSPAETTARASGNAVGRAPASTASPKGVQLVLRHQGVAISLAFSQEPTKETFAYLAGYCKFEQENVPSASDSKAVSDASDLA